LAVLLYIIARRMSCATTVHLQQLSKAAVVFDVKAINERSAFKQLAVLGSQ